MKLKKLLAFGLALVTVSYTHLNQEIKSYGLKEKVEAQMDQQLDESENLQWKAQILSLIHI